MLFLRLKRWVESQTMRPKHEQSEEYIDYRLPIDMLGPFESHEMGSLIYLRNNAGCVIVKETIEQIEGVITEIMTASQITR